MFLKIHLYMCHYLYCQINQLKILLILEVLRHQNKTPQRSKSKNKNQTNVSNIEDSMLKSQPKVKVKPFPWEKYQKQDN